MERALRARFMLLTGFAATRPRYELSQARSLDWLASAHTEAEATHSGLDRADKAAFATRIARVIQRCACAPDKIERRGHSVRDVELGGWDGNTIYDLRRSPHGAGTAERSRLYSEIVDAYFDDAYTADGMIRYSLVPSGIGGLRVVALHEQLVPDSAAAMRWVAGDHGMQMTLARDVPERIAAVLRAFVIELYGRAGIPLARTKDTVFAVHPGGPRIIDGVQRTLELTDAQVATSRAVLRDHGNMSSATLPHVWQRLDTTLPTGTLVASLAFGPGLTVCGALFEKC